MKTRILSIACLLSLGLTGFAQTSVEKSATATDITVNITNSVSVNATSGYTWTATNSTGTAITNKVDVDATKTPTVSVIFNGTIGDIGSLNVFATSTDGCKGNNFSASYKIVAPGDLPLKASVVAVDANVCPVTDNSDAGAGDIAYTINFFANDGTAAPVQSFIYQINAETAVTVSDVAGATSYALNLDTNYDNTETGAKVIRILKITQSATVGALYSAATAANATVTVDKAPELSGF